MQLTNSTPKLLSSRILKRRFLYLMFLLSFHLQLVSVDAVAQYSKLLDFGDDGGHFPYGSLISVGNYLYGMTSKGGAYCGGGTIFKIKADGSGFVKLKDFDGENGAHPLGSLFSDGTFLYGMTEEGGLSGYGTIFKIKFDGSGYSKLLDFDGINTGGSPTGNLISDGTFLYGMTSYGGEFGAGTIFRIATDKSSFRILHEFHFRTDGINPLGSLTLVGSTLYGMTSSGGVNDFGTVFKIMPNGTGGFDFTKLFDFDEVASGSYPKGSLISEGTTLYGMTEGGGLNNFGVIFKIESELTFTKLHDLQGSAVGGEPYGDLILEGGFLYGLTSYSNEGGTIFKIKPDGTSFENLRNLNYAHGATPYGSLISDGKFFYGMTYHGGGQDFGTIFKIKFDGTEFNKLHEFRRATYLPLSVISDGTFLYGVTGYGGASNSGTMFKVLPDGSNYTTVFDFYDGYPPGSLLFDGTFLYGMTLMGGLNSVGAIFKVLPDGTGYSRIFDFAGSNGSMPRGSLISDGTFLYGMTYWGGNKDNSGVIFKIKPDGTGYVSLSTFDEPGAGKRPQGSLFLKGNVLYGMTSLGGSNNQGTIFKLNSDGTDYVTLHNFGGSAVGDGGDPWGSLISDGTFLYGMTSNGGQLNLGTIFKIKADGTGYSILHEFAGRDTFDGSFPIGSLTLDGTYLYGLTQSGGSSDLGTMFKMLPDGTDYTVLHNFNGTVTGRYPNGALLRLGPSFFGVTSSGGDPGGGTVFKYQLPCAEVVTITATNTELTASTGDNYQWYYFGEAISEATSQSLEYSTLEYGEYAVDVMKKGCTYSATFDYIITGQQQEVNASVQVFPNPFKENLMVTLAEANYTLKVTDRLGRVILEQRGVKGSNELKTGGLSSGLYYLIAKSHDDVIVFKLQKL